MSKRFKEPVCGGSSHYWDGKPWEELTSRLSHERHLIGPYHFFNGYSMFSQKPLNFKEGNYNFIQRFCGYAPDSFLTYVYLPFFTGIYELFSKTIIQLFLPNRGGLTTSGWGEIAAAALLNLYKIEPYTPQGILLEAVLEATVIAVGSGIGNFSADLFFNMFSVNPETHPTVQEAHQHRAQLFTDLEKNDLIEGVRKEDPRALRLIEIYTINALELENWRSILREKEKDEGLRPSSEHLPFYVTEKLAWIEKLRKEEKAEFIKGLIYKDPHAHQALESLELQREDQCPLLAHLADRYLTTAEKSALLNDNHISLTELLELLGEDFKPLLQKWTLETHSLPLKTAA